MIWTHKTMLFCTICHTMKYDEIEMHHKLYCPDLPCSKAITTTFIIIAIIIIITI